MTNRKDFMGRSLPEPGHPARRLELPVGTLLRVLPNHACATAAQHAHYDVLGVDGKVADRWPRFMGW